MKIYIATSGQLAAMKSVRSDSPHKRVYGFIDYPHMLESYHYINKNDVWISAAREHGVKFFLDSGAFSAYTQGISINLEQYAKFIHEHKDIICVASNLDDTSKNEWKSWNNLKALESLGCNVRPVHHARESDAWLKRYLDRHDHILLGGLVPEKTENLRNWLDHVWCKYLTNPDGSPRVKVHGFGLTTRSLIFRYPWYSVDSTSWVKTAANGGVNIDLQQADGTWLDLQVDFSAKHPARYRHDSLYFANLTKRMQHALLQRLEQLEAERSKFPAEEDIMQEELGCTPGFNPDAFRASYGWRAWCNVEYYRRLSRRGRP